MTHIKPLHWLFFAAFALVFWPVEMSAWSKYAPQSFAPPPTISTLTYAATVDLDMSPSLAPYRTVALTGDITFTTSNKASGRQVTVFITSDASSRNLTFPSWVFVGGSAPASIAASKTAALTILTTSTTDASVIASYSVQP